jgi:hypothetical protein
MNIVAKIAFTFFCFLIGFLIAAGSAIYLMCPEKPPASPEPAAETAIDHSRVITADIVGLVQNAPESTHALTAISSAGTMEIVMAIPPHSSWPKNGSIESDITMSIQYALDRGAIAFQLILLGEEPGAIATK